jgi:hypothetical protein
VIPTASRTRNKERDGRKDEPTYATVIPGREVMQALRGAQSQVKS